MKLEDESRREFQRQVNDFWLWMTIGVMVFAVGLALMSRPHVVRILQIHFVPIAESTR
jgi:hypothetical protein